MQTAFYLAAAIAIAATAMVVTRRNVVHALLYLVLSLLAIAVVFFTLGAPFVAALEVIVYAGAIMVLFVFVVMMLNLGPAAVAQEREWTRPGVWILPAILAAVLFGEVVFLLGGAGGPNAGGLEVTPAQVATALYGPYVLAVELASLLLLAGLIGAYHLGRRGKGSEDEL
jgi:NADH-quinone oxidoreductase subunit J